MVTFSNLIDGASAVANIVGGISASNSANKAAGQSEALTNAQLEALSRQEGIYDSGADALETVLAQVLEAFGGRGQYDPQFIDDMASLLAQERATGEEQTKSDILEERTLQAGRQQDEMLRELGIADALFAPTADNINPRKEFDVRFNTNTYDDALNKLTEMFKANLDVSSDRNLNETMSKMIADNQRKLGGASSGQAVVNARMMADAKDEAEARNMLTALNMATSQLQGLQGLDANLQSGNINAQNANISGLNYDKALQDMLFKQAIASADAGQKFSQGAAGGERLNQASVLGALTGVNNLNQNTDLLDYTNALRTLGIEQGLANTTLNTLQNVTTAPYNYRVQGPQGILANAPNAATGANNLLSTFSTAAGNSFNAAGQGIENFFKESNLGSQDVSSLFNTNTGSTQASPTYAPVGIPSFVGADEFGAASGRPNATYTDPWGVI